MPFFKRLRQPIPEGILLENHHFQAHSAGDLLEVLQFAWMNSDEQLSRLNRRICLSVLFAGGLKQPQDVGRIAFHGHGLIPIEKDSIC